MLRAENHLRSADVELQQRAAEYIQLSNVASIDVLVSSLYYVLFHPCRWHTFVDFHQTFVSSVSRDKYELSRFCW